MSDSGQFQVDADQLRAHAASVGDLANQLSSVAGGGQAGGLSDNALGSFVQFLTSGLQDAMNQTTQAVSGAATGVDNVSLRLSQTAQGYQNSDTGNAGQFTGIQSAEEASS